MLIFCIVYTLIAAPCILYTGYALTAYTGCPMWLSAMVYAMLTLSWFSMLFLWHAQTHNSLLPKTYALCAKIGYTMLGFAFLLLCAFGIRDAVWMIAYLLPFNVVSPFDEAVRITANVWTLGLVAGAGIYAIYVADKMPRLVTYKFTDKRIKKNVKILAISDLHINKAVSIKKTRQYVQYFNALHPDILLMAGDIVDDLADDVKLHLKELKKLKAPLGIYITLGNHEVYFNALRWEAEYAALGWQVLHNSGVNIENTGIYIGGVPSNAGFRPNPKQTLNQAQDACFKILAAHEPSIAYLSEAAGVDIQFSGHTHGGQIFPFHFPVKWGNSGFVSGTYTLNQTMLIVSNGAGYWGPPMRLLAQNDVILMEFAPISSF